MGYFGVRHGDILTLEPTAGSNTALFGNQFVDGVGRERSASTASTVGRERSASTASTRLPEDEVDIQLYKMDGKIERKKDDRL